MATAIYDDHGIRFEYPADWSVEVPEDGPRKTVALQSPSGLAFALVTLDEEGLTPAEMADEALAAMREEYPTMDVAPGRETLGGHPAIGHDLEFLSLDVPNSCVIRAFGTPRRCVLVFAQWSDLDDQDPEGQVNALRRSLEVTDS